MFNSTLKTMQMRVEEEQTNTKFVNTRRFQNQVFCHFDQGAKLDRHPNVQGVIARKTATVFNLEPFPHVWTDMRTSS